MEMGMLFDSRGVYRQVLRDWVIRNGWDLKYSKSRQRELQQNANVDVIGTFMLLQSRGATRFKLSQSRVNTIVLQLLTILK